MFIENEKGLKDKKDLKDENGFKGENGKIENGSKDGKFFKDEKSFKNAESGNENFKSENNDAQEGAEKKLFTQEEVDALIKVRLARAAKSAKEAKFAESEEIKTLKEEAEKNLGMISSLRKEADDAAQRLLAYELKDKIIKKGVEPKFADFALYEIKKDIESGIEFDDAFERFYAENDFSVKERLATGLKQGGNISSVSAVEDSFYKINPMLKQ